MTEKQLGVVMKINGCTSEAELRLMTDLLSKHGGVIVELGCLYGRASKAFWYAMHNCGKLYCIDSFVINGEDAKRSFKENILQTHSRKIVKLIEKPVHEASNDFANYSIDFLFIDADHQDHSIQEDLRDWLPKVKARGLVAFHDYHNDMFPSVKRRVDEATEDWKVVAEVDRIVIKQRP